MRQLNGKGSRHGTQDTAHSINFAKLPEPGNGNTKKKVKIVYMSDCTSSSDDEGSDDISDSDSLETAESSGGMNYEEEGGGISSCSEEEPPEKRRKKSGDQMKKRNDTGEHRPDHNDDQEEEEAQEEEYYVEKILEMEFCPETKKNFFLVKWLNYGSEENTWEPEEHLDNSKDLLDEFLGRSKSNGNFNRVKNVRKQKQTRSNGSSTLSSGSTKRKHSDISDSDRTAANSKSRVVLKNKNRNVSESSESEEDVDRRIKVPLSHVKKGVQITSPNKTLNDSGTSTDLTNMDWLEETLNLGVTSVIGTRPGNIFYFRVIANDGNIEWLDIDTTAPLPNYEEVYRCVVTEDLAGKKPKLIYGATTSLDGQYFCLVQFEGQNYVDVIPPSNLFARFPSFRKFFELHCPKLFSQKS